MFVFDGIFKGIRNRGLANYRIKGGGPVFTRRNNKIIHIKTGADLGIQSYG